MGGFRARYLVVPLLLALIVTGAVYVYLNRAEGANGRLATTKVVIAVKAVPAKAVLTVDMLGTKEIPRDFVLPNAVTDVSQIVGKMVLAPLAEGEMVVSGKIDQKDTASGMAARIPQGMRAVTVAVDEIIGVAGFPQPGDAVDVISTIKPTNGGEPITRTVLERIAVLAVGTQIDAKGQPTTTTGLTSFTLCVTPGQATTLAHVSGVGEIRLALRPTGDEGTGRGATVTSGGLTVPTGGGVAPTTTNAVQTAFTVQVLSVKSGGLAALGLAPANGPTLASLSANALAQARLLIGNGTARVLATSEVAILTGQAGRFAATTQFAVPATVGGTSVMSWQEYGLSVGLELIAVNKPLYDLRLRPEVRIARYLIGANGVRNPVPDIVLRAAEGTLRLDAAGAVSVHGLVKADDFRSPTGVAQQFVVPEQMAPEEVRLGTAELVVLIIPR